MEYQSFFIVFKKYQFKNDEFVDCSPHIAHGFLQVNKQGQTTVVCIKLNNKIAAKVDFFCAEYHKQINLDGDYIKFFIDEPLDYKKIAVVIESEQLFASNCDTQTIKNYIKKIVIIPQKNKKQNMFSKIFGEVPITYFFDSIRPKLSKVFVLGKSCKVDKMSEGKWTTIVYDGQTKLFGVIYKQNFPIVIAVGTEKNKKECYSNAVFADDKYFDTIFLNAENGSFLQFCGGNWH